MDVQAEGEGKVEGVVGGWRRGGGSVGWREVVYRDLLAGEDGRE